jgi:hypothetical protein
VPVQLVDGRVVRMLQLLMLLLLLVMFGRQLQLARRMFVAFGCAGSEASA